MNTEPFDLSRLTFVDVETPNRDSNSVCEISAIESVDGEIRQDITELINPQSPFHKMNIKIHGIYPEDVADKQTFDIFYDAHADLFQEDHILVGHNIRSDINIIQKDLARYNRKLPTHYCIDTQDIVRKYLYHDEPPKGAMSLGNVCKAMSIDLNAHSASSDASACIEILQHFKNEPGFELKDFVQDATTSKTKQRKEMIEGYRNLPPGTLMRHREMGEVRLVSVRDGTVTVEGHGITMNFQFPSSFLRGILTYTPPEETDPSESQN